MQGDLVVRPSQFTLVDLAAKAVHANELPTEALPLTAETQVKAISSTMARVHVLNASAELEIHYGSTFGDLKRAFNECKLVACRLKPNLVLGHAKTVDDKSGLLMLWMRKCIGCMDKSMLSLYADDALIPDCADQWMVCLLDTNLLVKSPIFEQRLVIARDNASRSAPKCFDCMNDESLVYDSDDEEGPQGAWGFGAIFHLLNAIVDSFVE
jgi:hypothetical protein